MNPRVWLSVLSLSFLWLCSRATDQTGAASVSSENPVDEISSGETVALVGTITAASAWGAPNFGETPEQDKKESYFILSTTRPIRMKDTDGSRLPDTVQVQLILSGASGDFHSEIKKYAEGTSIEVTGKAYPATTGHHHESIVLNLETVKKASGPWLAVNSDDKAFFRALKTAVVNDVLPIFFWS